VATFYIPITHGTKIDYKAKNKTNGPKDQKKKRDCPPRRSLREILQQGAGSSGVPARDPGATSEPAAVTSAKGRDEPMVRNLPEVELGTSFSGTGGIKNYKNFKTFDVNKCLHVRLKRDRSKWKSATGCYNTIL
jgi:hypothetical protein